MKIVRQTSGILAHRLDKIEQDAIWRELDKPCYSSSTPFFTPKDNLKYFVISSKQDGYRCIDTISANGKTFNVVADVCKLDDKILKAVRKAYNK